MRKQFISELSICALIGLLFSQQCIGDEPTSEHAARNNAVQEYTKVLDLVHQHLLTQFDVIEGSNQSIINFNNKTKDVTQIQMDTVSHPPKYIIIINGKRFVLTRGEFDQFVKKV